MFVRMLTVDCDQSDSYEKVRKINEIINVIFGPHYGNPFLALRPKLGSWPSWVLDEIRIFWGKPCLSNKDSLPNLIQRKCRSNLKNPFCRVLRYLPTYNRWISSFNIRSFWSDNAYTENSSAMYLPKFGNC